MNSESQSNQQAVDPSTWPAILSIPLREYLNKGERPFIRLWAMCDLTEVILRLGAIVGLAEIRGLKGELPDKLRSITWNIIQRPTIGQWKVIVKAILENLPKDNIIHKDFQTIFYDNEFGLIPMLDGPKENRAPTNSLSTLRNEVLAHGGGVNSNHANGLLNIWEPRFEKILKNCSQSVSNWRFFCASIDNKELKELCDPYISAHPLQLSEETLERVKNKLSDNDTEGDAIVLVRGETVRQLWPLALYGPPLSESGEDNSYLSPTPQIYGRHDTFLEYTPIGSEDLWRSVGSDSAREQFKKLLEPVRTKSEYKVRDFEKDLQDDARMFVGRKEQLQSIHELLSDKNHGVLWMTGRPGIGKSFLTAHVALNPFPIPKPSETHEQHADRLSKLLVLAYRFKVGDDRCSSSVFFQFALERLKLWQGLKDVDAQKKDQNKKKDLNKMVSPEVEFRETLNRVNTEAGYLVLLVLDGCDELLQVERHKHFFKKGPIDCGKIPGVVWLCAGRPEDALMKVFSDLICTPVFPYGQNEGGVPPMDIADIRQILLNQLEGPLRKRLLNRDQESNDTQEIKNNFISSVAAYSQGLPLYVRFVLGDIAKNGTLSNFNPNQLPKSLEDFYQNLINQAGIGVLQTITSPIIALLALANEPLDVDIILVFLRERTLLTGDPNKDRKNVNQALNAVASLLQIKSTYENEDGYILNHNTLREYLKRPEMDDLIAPARKSLNDSCAKPELLKSAARGYLVRQSTKHLLEGECWDKLYNRLTNLVFLEAKNEAGLVFDLNDDFRNAFEKWPTDTLYRVDQKHVLQLLKEALKRDQNFIHRHSDPEGYPQGLFQCLWNNLSALNRPGNPDIDVTSGHSSKPSNISVGSVPAGLKIMLDEWYNIQKTRNTPWFRVSGSRKNPPGWVMREHTDLICTADAWENPENPSELWLVSAGHDCTVKLWNPDTGEVKQNLSHENTVRHVIFLHDGRIISGDDDGIICLWDPREPTENTQVVVKLDEGEAVTSLIVFFKKGIIAGGNKGTIVYWDSNKDTCKKKLKHHEEEISCMKVFSETSVISGSSDSQIKIWNPTNEESETIFKCETGVSCLAIQPGTGNIIVGCKDGTVLVLDASVRQEDDPLFEFLNETIQGSVTCIAIMGDKNQQILVAVSSEEEIDPYESKTTAIVMLVNLVTGECVYDEETDYPIYTIARLSHNSFILVTMMDVYLINLDPIDYQNSDTKFLDHRGCIDAVVFDERYVISWGMDFTVHLNSANNLPTETFENHKPEYVYLHKLNSDQILTATISGQVKIWDPHTTCSSLVFDYSQDADFELNCFCQLKSGIFVFGGSSLIIWAQDWNKEQLLKKFRHKATCLVELDNGEVALGFSNGAIEIFEMPSGQRKFTQNRVHKGAVIELLSFPDGMVVSSGQDSKIRLWNINSNKINTLFQSEHGTNCLEKLPDGKVVTFLSKVTDFEEDSDYSIRVWDTQTGELEATLEQDYEITFLKTLPNGTIILGIGDDLIFYKNFLDPVYYKYEFENELQNLFLLENGQFVIAFDNHEIQIASESEDNGYSFNACYYPISDIRLIVLINELNQFWIVGGETRILSLKLEGFAETRDI